jgi:hypothetical protein
MYSLFFGAWIYVYVMEEAENWLTSINNWLRESNGLLAQMANLINREQRAGVGGYSW